LPLELHGFFILPPFGVHYAQHAVSFAVPRVDLNLLLIRPGRFIQFPIHSPIVDTGDPQFFPFAGMFSQLECLGDVLAGPHVSPRE